jgi:hypothetical protein
MTQTTKASSTGANVGILVGVVDGTKLGMMLG